VIHTSFYSALKRSSHGAFYVLYPNRVRKSVSLWKAQLPAVKPFYAVKCNPDPTFLNLLYDNDISFDCASEKELLDVQSLSREEMKNRIIYANPCKSVRDLNAAAAMGSPITVVDSVEELVKLGEINYSGGALVRIAVPDSGSLMPFSTKFGLQPDKVEMIADAAKIIGIPLHGISFHVGSGCLDTKTYKTAIDVSVQCALKMRASQKHPATIIDIGGGFIPDEVDFKAKAMAIRGAIFAAKAKGEFDWIAEPGRFFAGNSFDFFVQVIAKRIGSGGYHYTIDDSLYGQFSSILFDHAEPKWVRVRKNSSDRIRDVKPGVLFGKTCDSVDVIARGSMEELSVGDWLWFPHMGAYTRATASEFNGFPKPGVILADRNSDMRVDWSEDDMRLAVPTGLKYMPTVTARGFWQ
jgi:ornithine decarboxylase